MQTNELITRLSRIEGQVKALKHSVGHSATKTDCKKTLQQVKAANNALKRFGEAFAREYAMKCLTENKSGKKLAGNIDDVISSAFILS